MKIKSLAFGLVCKLMNSIIYKNSIFFILFQFSLYLLIYRKEYYVNVSNEQFTLQLLRTFTHQISDEDVLAIRKMLSDYFAKKAMDLADDAWGKNNWISKETEKLSTEHNRKSLMNDSSN